MSMDNVVKTKIRPLTVRIGATVEGVRLGGDLDDAEVRAIREALLAHKVLFFRGQHHLDDDSHYAFTERMGTPIPHPTAPAANGNAAVFPVDSVTGRATVWHSDVSFVADYPAISVLRGVVIPPCGGDTVWANTVTAYRDLPAPLRTLAESIRAVHTNAHDYAAASRTRPASRAEKEFRTAFEAVTFETEHPLVRVHPETGERSLLLGGFAQRFVGFPKDDSEMLHQLFQRYITRVENTVRWRWSGGDVAMWDNRATQHAAVDDYGDAPRLLHRLTVHGEIPVGVDGRESVVRVGAEAPWYERAAA